MKFYIGSGFKNCELALNKKIFLCSATEDEFSVENTVNFYQLPQMKRIVGSSDDNIKQILDMDVKH